MAKITGPLFSIDAAGNFASGAMQFRGGLRGTHAYRPAQPKTVNQAPATVAQAAVRTAYQQIVAEWRALAEQDKLAWDAAASATSTPITGWNLYFKSRIQDVMHATNLPNPDTYTAPAANNILFPGTTWVTDTEYTAPANNAINFE